jgi:sugar/nucleoside kinase (ribokinase family)
MATFPVENVLVTHGAQGGYLITGETADHFPIHDVAASKTCDETGCGDQVTAVMAAEIAAGTPLATAAVKAMVAGSMQFIRSGIQPVTHEELAE